MAKRATLIAYSDEPISDLMIDYMTTICLFMPPFHKPESDFDLQQVSAAVNNFAAVSQQWLMQLQFDVAISLAHPHSDTPFGRLDRYDLALPEDLKGD